MAAYMEQLQLWYFGKERNPNVQKFKRSEIKRSEILTFGNAKIKTQTLRNPYIWKPKVQKSNIQKFKRLETRSSEIKIQKFKHSETRRTEIKHSEFQTFRNSNV